MTARHTLLVLAMLTTAVANASDCPPDIAALRPDDLNKVSADDRAAGLPGTLRCAAAEVRAGINVVAYTASDIGAVSVVRNGSPPTVLYEVPGKAVGGHYPGVIALDVDGDHANEPWSSSQTPVV
jgi:hypothetical protein